jgi:superfamily II DNA or RNA helicase
VTHNRTPFITLEFLEENVNPKDLACAQHAMDTQSVHTYSFDRRGRIEAGIRPASTSSESPSHARITRRGQRYRTECLLHGKGIWCIHTLILALYQADYQPEYQVKKPILQVRSKVDPPLLMFLPSHDYTMFKFVDPNSGSIISGPRDMVEHQVKAHRWTEATAEAVLDNSEQKPGDAFLRIETPDLGSVLFALRQNKPEPVSLCDGSKKLFQWDPLMPFPPEIHVHWRQGQLTWEWKGSHIPQKQDFWLPGRPGFCIRENRIITFPYLSQLTKFMGSGSGQSNQINYKELLTSLLSCRHQVRWGLHRPELIDHNVSFCLRLSPSGQDLVVDIGIWDHDTFYPFEGLKQSVQQFGPGLFMKMSPPRKSQLVRDLTLMKLPSEHFENRGKIVYRGDTARDFIENTHFPQDWYIIRHEADDWFGLKKSTCESSWNLHHQVQPVYRIGNEEFEHETLMSHLMPSKTGICLPNGKTIRFDTSELLQNHEILSSVKRVFEEESRQKYLLQRILHPGEDAVLPKKKSLQVHSRWLEILREYQQQGLIWMLELKEHGLSGLLADDMGLGKTVQTLAYLDVCKGDLPQLIVVPKTLMGNWSSEIKRFTAHRRISIHHGPKRIRDAGILQKADLVLTTYGTVLRDEELLYDVHFDIVVLDEAQNIKNPGALTTRAVCELWSETRLALTGTPIENHFGEFWSLFEFLMPDFLGDKTYFQGFIPPSSPFFQAVRKKTRPLILRRLKKEVESELPEKVESTVSLPLSAEQELIYREIQKSSQNTLQNDKKSVPSILTMILRLRQACCHPGLISDTLLSAESVKFKYLLDVLREVHREGHAALVFSQFTKLLQLFRYELEEENIPYLYLDGKTRNRQELVDRFQSGEGSVFLISLKAGGTGLNLTRASYVYHLDPWWNPMVEEQATDRSHRIGQTQKVMVYKIMTRNTIEEAISKLQRKKKRMALGLWDETGQTLPVGLSQAELIDLIGKSDYPS